MNKNLGGDKEEKMKTKNKVLALFEITIVLCSVFLVALPVTAIAAEQTTQKVSANEITTASEDDYVLDIYGNANEDDTIDMRDLTYVKLIFFGKKPETELADAKYDGKINPLDFIQIKLIIVGKEKELTLVDVLGKDVTVNKPVERVVTLPYASSPDAIRAIGAKDKVVGICTSHPDEVYFPELSKLPSVGHSWFNPDYEAIIELRPDIVLTLGRYNPGIEDKLEPAGITVVRIEFNKIDLLLGEMKKLGYILDTEKEAEEFISWYEGWLNMIKERTEELSEDEKVRVYGALFYLGGIDGKGTVFDSACELTGGINIGSVFEEYCQEVDPEWVITQNPDIIVKGGIRASGYETDDPTAMEMMRKEILSDPAWKDVRAVKNERVYLIGYQLRVGTHTIVGLAYLAKWFYPELFEDLDPQAIHQEYIDKFCDIDFNVYEHGVFVYPPLE